MGSKKNIIEYLTKTPKLIFIVTGIICLAAFGILEEQVSKIILIALLIFDLSYIIARILFPKEIVALARHLPGEEFSNHTKKDHITGLVLYINLLCDTVFVGPYDLYLNPEISLAKFLIYLSLISLCIGTFLEFVPYRPSNQWIGSLVTFVFLLFVLYLQRSSARSWYLGLSTAEYPILSIVALVIPFLLIFYQRLFQKYPKSGFILILSVVVLVAFGSEFGLPLWSRRTSNITSLILLTVSFSFYSYIKIGDRHFLFSLYTSILVLFLFLKTYKEDLVTSISKYWPLVSEHFPIFATALAAIQILVAGSLLLKEIPWGRIRKEAKDKNNSGKQ